MEETGKNGTNNCEQTEEMKWADHWVDWARRNPTIADMIKTNHDEVMKKLEQIEKTLLDISK